MNFEKKNNIYKTVMTIIVTAIVVSIATTVLLYNYYFKTEDGIVKTLVKTETSNLDARIMLIKEYIDQFYLGEVNEETMIETAIKGYVAGLGDDYTEYLTKDEYEELMIEVDGDYVGIGIYMTQDRDGNVLVLLPIEGSPAEEAGLKTGDIITKVNGEDCVGIDLNIVANKVKGEEGTTVDLEILREGEFLNKTITRRTVEIRTVATEVINDNIGYIEILSFDTGCSDKIETILNDYKNRGIKSIIIDLRDNGGGLVSEATDMADLFLQKDSNIMVEIDNKGNAKTTKAEKEPIIDSNMKIIILTNENSASASEILVGALKDNGTAKVVGTKTFGKGVMQELIPVSSGGALKLTIKEFCTPNGSKINKEGIKPDIEIEDNEKTEIDEQLQKAIEMCK